MEAHILTRGWCLQRYHASTFSEPVTEVAGYFNVSNKPDQSPCDLLLPCGLQLDIHTVETILRVGVENGGTAGLFSER